MEASKAASLTTRNRVAEWNARYSALFDRFEAELQPGQLGALRFAHLHCIGSAINRAQCTDTSSVPSYTVVVQLAGSSLLSQYGQQAELQTGDIALCDNTTPYSHQMAEHAELVMMRVPSAALREHLPSPEQFCGRRLPSALGTTAVAASLVTSLCRRARTDLPAAVQDRLVRQVLEMVAISFTLTFDALIAPSSAIGGRFAKARRYIEQNLRDPELGPQSIARSLNVSSRYLRMIFAGEKESVSAYILRRRLEEIAQELIDPRWRGRSICEIAFGWGFNSAPHFSRSFRERFAMSPRQYRMRNTGVHGRSGTGSLAAVG